MLLCDGCGAGFHIFCVDLQIADIPEGDWLCPACNKAQDGEGCSDTSDQSAEMTDGSQGDDSDFDIEKEIDEARSARADQMVFSWLLSLPIAELII